MLLLNSGGDGAINFGEKLDFLMSLTRTTNGALALHTFLDPSYISRLRRGKRKPVRKGNYVKAIASYLSKRCVEDYQRQALLDALGQPVFVFEDWEHLSELVHGWMLDERLGCAVGAQGAGEIAGAGGAGKIARAGADGSGSDPAGTRVGPHSGAFSFQVKSQIREAEAGNFLRDPEPEGQDVRVYYGIEGKRKAAAAFLSLVVKAEKPHTLLLFSDEDFGWISEDPAFAARWAGLMSQAIMKGNRIKMIHTVSRHLDEMVEGLMKWIPLYMTGAIEPYYYPKKRDGVFNRSLFVAPGTAAVTSDSIGDMAGEAANFLLTNPKTVEAVTREYENYLKFCKPLMRVFGPHERFEYLRTLDEFECENAGAIMMTGSFSLLSAPAEIAGAMYARQTGAGADELIEHFRARKQRFMESLRSNRFTEIVMIPDISLIKEGKVCAGLARLMTFETMHYTSGEFRRHLENVVALLQNYENYRVCIAAGGKETGYMLYVKEDVGAVVAATSNPPVVFAINESNLTAALWDLLQSRIDSLRLGRDQVIARLQRVVADLA